MRNLVEYRLWYYSYFRKYYFFSCDYLLLLLHNPVFCNMGVGSLKPIYWLWRALYLRFNSRDLKRVFLVDNHSQLLTNCLLLLFILCNYLCCLIHKQFFRNMGVWNLKRIFYFAGLYLRFSQCDLNLVFSRAHTPL